MPEPGLGQRLVEAYFTNVNAYAPLLHRAYFDRCMRAGLLESDLPFRSLYCKLPPSPLESSQHDADHTPLSPVMVCAIGARFVDDDSVFPVDPTGTYIEGPQQSRGYDFFSSASVTCSPKLSPATLFDLQSQCLAVQWLAASASPTTAWSATGHAFRRLVDVAGHREKATRWHRSPLQDQLRRRCFAVLYDADRHLSATLGRPVALHETEFDVLDPADVTDEELDEWEARGGATAPAVPAGRTTAMTGLLALHRLRKITERILVGLYSTGGPGSVEQINERVTELDSLLNEWLAELPSEMQWNPTTVEGPWLVQSGILISSWYATQILLHRDFLSPAKASLHTFPSMAICSNASRSIAQVLNVLLERGVLDLGAPSHPITAVTAALALLINVFAQAPTGTALTSSAMSDVAKCERVLDVLGGSTFMARRCFVALGEMIEKIRQGQRLASFHPGVDGHGLGGHKRPAEEGSRSSSSAHSPASEGSPKQSGALKKSRGAGGSVGVSVTELPMTTGELGRSTFAGRPTFNLPKAAGVQVGAAVGAGEASGAWIDSFLSAAGAAIPLPLTSDPAPYGAWEATAGGGGLGAGGGLPAASWPAAGLTPPSSGGGVGDVGAWGAGWMGGYEGGGEGFGGGAALPVAAAMGPAGFAGLSPKLAAGYDVGPGGGPNYGSIDWDALLGGSGVGGGGIGVPQPAPEVVPAGYYGF